MTAGETLSQLHLFGVVQAKDGRKWSIQIDGIDFHVLSAKSLDRVTEDNKLVKPLQPAVRAAKNANKRKADPQIAVKGRCLR
jgi:hypothetical protein